MKQYFKNYPQVSYSLPTNSIMVVGEDSIFSSLIYDYNKERKNTTVLYDTKTIVDITKLFKLKDILKKNLYIYYPYTIKENDTPEKIAYYYYDDSYYFWLVLLSNNIINPYYEWPLNDIQFAEYIEMKYSTTTQNGHTFSTTNYFYFTGNGYLVDYYTWTNSLEGDQLVGKYRTSYYDYEFELNENKRNINLVGKQFLDQINREVSKVFS